MENRSLLQLELERIEAEASKHSQMICAAANALEAAYQVCQQINDNASLANPAEPFIAYCDFPSRCEMTIYGREDSLSILLALQAVGIQIEHERPSHMEGLERFLLPGYPGTVLIVTTSAMRNFYRNHLAETA